MHTNIGWIACSVQYESPEKVSFNVIVGFPPSAIDDSSSFGEVFSATIGASQ